MADLDKFMLARLTLMVTLLFPLPAIAQLKTQSFTCGDWVEPVFMQISTDIFFDSARLRTSCVDDQLSITYPATDHVVDIAIPILDNRVANHFAFYGLAAYYNAVRIVKPGNSKSVEGEFESSDWIGIVGRFRARLYQASGATVEITEESLHYSWPENTPVTLHIISTYKPELQHINPQFDELRYHSLWRWLALLSEAVEWSLVKIQANLTNSWGWSIFIFALLIKMLLLPVSILSTGMQRQVSQKQALLEPQLIEIKARYDGEEAHNRIMAAYKALDISPFYAMKPLIGTFIQLPILIAIFNALGEMHQFNGQSFLWIVDLAYPDAIASLPFTVPLFGESLNLLPFLMTLITIVATLMFQNEHAPEAELKRQKRNLYFMSAAFFVLFYPFPAVMVLYWALTNFLHIIQQHFLRI